MPKVTGKKAHIRQTKLNPVRTPKNKKGEPIPWAHIHNINKHRQLAQQGQPKEKKQKKNTPQIEEDGEVAGPSGYVPPESHQIPAPVMAGGGGAEDAVDAAMDVGVNVPIRTRANTTPQGGGGGGGSVGGLLEVGIDNAQDVDMGYQVRKLGEHKYLVTKNVRRSCNVKTQPAESAIHFTSLDGVPWAIVAGAPVDKDKWIYRTLGGYGLSPVDPTNYLMAKSIVDMMHYDQIIYKHRKLTMCGIKKYIRNHIGGDNPVISAAREIVDKPIGIIRRFNTKGLHGIGFISNHGYQYDVNNWQGFTNGKQCTLEAEETVPLESVTHYAHATTIPSYWGNIAGPGAVNGSRILRTPIGAAVLQELGYDQDELCDGIELVKENVDIVVWDEEIHRELFPVPSKLPEQFQVPMMNNIPNQANYVASNHPGINQWQVGNTLLDHELEIEASKFEKQKENEDTQMSWNYGVDTYKTVTGINLDPVYTIEWFRERIPSDSVLKAGRDIHITWTEKYQLIFEGIHTGLDRYGKSIPHRVLLSNSSDYMSDVTKVKRVLQNIQHHPSMTGPPKKKGKRRKQHQQKNMWAESLIPAQKMVEWV